MIKDAFQFCDVAADFEIKHAVDAMFMCSYDATSLFTNIPLQETLDICLDMLYWDEETPQPSAPERLLRKLLLKAITEVNN